MSKNIVDTIIEYSLQYDKEFILIPSRRQIEKGGGYVNNWTTKDFCTYVKSKSNGKVLIERDHGGPGQGFLDDNGIESILEDVKYMDILHIDPWKKYPIYSDALDSTIQLIETCYKVNPMIEYEVGTEEGIRPISMAELDSFLSDLRSRLKEEVYDKIRFVVIQCGTQLLEKENIGDFNPEKLVDMLEIVKKYGKEPKEHNGDWVDFSTICKKESYGLRYINIAPELGELETKVVLSFLSKQKEDYELFYNLCLSSTRWKKWVNDDFHPEKNKEKLMLICGHYMFSHEMFLQLKHKYLEMDSAIHDAIFDKLLEYDNIYTKRESCFLCGGIELETVFEKNKKIALSTALLSSATKGYFIPYNIQYCRGCHAFQNKYLGNPSLVYAINHIDSFGAVKSKMHSIFSDFITANKSIQNIIEVGACHDVLSSSILEKEDRQEITIIDPFYIGKRDKLTIVNKFLENVDLHTINANTVVMSSVFEHFYNPRDILKQLSDSKNIQYIYLNHPDLEYAIRNDIQINLNIEHTFYIDTNSLLELFNLYGFKMTRKDSYGNHTLCFEFTRIEVYDQSSVSIYHKDFLDIRKYFSRLRKKVEYINTFMEDNPSMTFHLWPTSIHLTPFFVHGLKTSRIKSFLDNSPNKIGKFLYGYDIPCESFENVISNANKDTCILLGGSPMYRNELRIANASCKFLDI